MSESAIQQVLQASFPSIQDHINSDPNFKASAAGIRCTFVIVSSDNPGASIIVGIDNQRATLDVGPAHASTFGLQANPDDWKAFFADPPVRPYQSYWGMLRVLGPDHGIEVLGDAHAFGRHARLWRIALDRVRDALHDRSVKTTLDEPPDDEVTDEDAVTGKYIWLSHSEYGRVKIFYESSGSGPQDILFLHTAGSDSRQYYSLMNNKTLQERCRMYAFDLPAHGRSSLGSKQSPGGYALNEESYLECIRLVIQRLKLRTVVLCGASMAGHV